MTTDAKTVTQQRYIIDVCNKIEDLNKLRNAMYHTMHINDNLRDSKTKEEIYLISQAIYNLELLRTSLLSN